MAAVQTLHSMTLGNQQPKMYTMIQQHSPHQQNNCVIVTTGLPTGQTIVTTNQNITGKSVIQHNAKRPLAPAPERTSVVVNTSSINNNNNINNNSDMLRCKRKINFAHHMSYSGHQPASVARRNARERNRVKQVNNGFATLRQHIPASVAAALSSTAPTGGRGASKKLSKVETLRMAVEYIRSLQQMIEEHEAETASSTTSSSSVSSENIKLENQYYTLSPSESSSVTMAQHLGQTMLLQQTPPCSEASASPTPSYSSEGSISTPNATYAPMVPYKPENYDNYEPMSPEDEELLDYISWWQQQ